MNVGVRNVGRGGPAGLGPCLPCSPTARWSTRSSPCSLASGAVCTSSGRTERPAPFRYGPPLARDLGQRGCCPDCLALIAAVAGRTCCGGHSTSRRTSTRTSTSTSSLRLDGAPSRRRHQRGTRKFHAEVSLTTRFGWGCQQRFAVNFAARLSASKCNRT